MKYPILLCLPVLMFLNYFLTVLSDLQREKKYSDFFKVKSSELNPVWQKDVAQKKWFNWRYFTVTILAFALLYFVVEYYPNEYAVQIILGIVLTVIAMNSATIVTNLLIFRYLAKAPNQLSGQIFLSDSYNLHVLLYLKVGMLLPFGFLAYGSQSLFAFGGLLGIGFLMLVNGIWIWQHNRKMAATELLK